MAEQHNLGASNNGGVINNRPALNSSPIGNPNNDRQVQQQQQPPHQQQQQMHPGHPMDYYEPNMPPQGPGMRSPSQSQGGGGMWAGPGPHYPPQHGHGMPSPSMSDRHQHYGHYGPPPHMQHGPPPGYSHYPPPYHHGPPSYGHYPPPHYGPPPHMQHGPPSAPTPPQQGRRGKDKDGSNKSSQSPEPNKPLHPKLSTSPTSSDGDVSPSKSQVNEPQTITVPPMRPDFHFFVQDHQDKLIEECKAELPLIYRRLRISPPAETDATFLFSHINERLIALWESTPQSQRQTYMLQEEEDRKRFMSAEEVASQHCATLTARVKSPAFSLEKSKKDDMTHEKKSRQLEETPDMLNPLSPTKKNRTEPPGNGPMTQGIPVQQSPEMGMPVQQETV